MVEEIFGPVLTIYIYEDNDFEQAMDLVDSTGEYALTGAVFAQDRHAVNRATERLVNAAKLLCQRQTHGCSRWSATVWWCSRIRNE